MLDEIPSVRRATCPPAELGLDGRERASDAEPHLGHDNGDRDEMNDAEPDAVDPAPAESVADDDHQEAADNESDDAQMNDQYRVC